MPAPEPTRASDGYMAAFHATLPYRGAVLPLTPSVPPVVCNRAVKVGQTFAPCGNTAAVVMGQRARCRWHR